MKSSASIRGLGLLFAAFTLLPVACDTGGLVGGKCKVDRLSCDGTCVDPRTDPNHCGRCDSVCEPGYVCSEGDCARPTGSGGTSSTGGNGSGEGGDAGATSGGAGAGTGGGGASGGVSNGGRGGTGGSAGGSSGRGGAGPQGGTGTQGGDAGAGGVDCVPPYRTNEHCGACDNACVDPAPYCIRQPDGSYGCAGDCAPGNVRCGNLCTDLDNDPRNCGRCGNVCPSLRCIDGECAGETPGHVALYCMDYTFADRRTAHSRLLGNALFLLPERLDLRILAFSRWAPAAVRVNVNRVIGWEALRFGRTYTLDTVTTVEDVENALRIENYDAFLVYDQSEAPSGELAVLGDTLSNELDAFTGAGGVVVALDGAQGTGEMNEFMSSAGLLQVDAQQTISLDGGDVDLYIHSQADQLAVGVVSPISAVAYTCTFDTPVAPSTTVSYVLTDAAPPAVGNPVIIHRVVP